MRENKYKKARSAAYNKKKSSAVMCWLSACVNAGNRARHPTKATPKKEALPRASGEARTALKLQVNVGTRNQLHKQPMILMRKLCLWLVAKVSTGPHLLGPDTQAVRHKSTSKS